MDIKYDYSTLRGLIRKNFKTQGDYADYIGISTVSLNQRLTNKLPFKQDEIAKSIEGFNLDASMIDEIFFCRDITENRINRRL